MQTTRLETMLAKVKVSNSSFIDSATLPRTLTCCELCRTVILSTVLKPLHVRKQRRCLRNDKISDQFASQLLFQQCTINCRDFWYRLLSSDSEIGQKISPRAQQRANDHIYEIFASGRAVICQRFESIMPQQTKRRAGMQLHAGIRPSSNDVAKGSKGSKDFFNVSLYAKP